MNIPLQVFIIFAVETVLLLIDKMLNVQFKFLLLNIFFGLVKNLDLLTKITEKDIHEGSTMYIHPVQLSNLVNIIKHISSSRPFDMILNIKINMMI